MDRHCSSLFHCHRWRGGASSNKLHDITSVYCRFDVFIHTYHLFICTSMFLIMKLFYHWCSQLCCADDVCNRSFTSSHCSFTHDCVAESRLENDLSRVTNRPGTSLGLLRHAEACWTYTALIEILFFISFKRLSETQTARYTVNQYQLLSCRAPTQRPTVFRLGRRPKDRRYFD